MIKIQRFIKNKKSLVDALLSYGDSNGGFKHIKSGQVDLMATGQAMYAMEAYYRFVNNQNRLYDMTDVGK